MVEELGREEILQLCSERFGDDFSIRNNKLTDYLWEDGDEGLKVQIVRQMRLAVIYDMMGQNGVIQDELSDKEMDEVSLEEGTEEELRQEKEDNLNLLYSVDNHLEIGRRLGMTLRGIGTYDALTGYFREAYIPNVLDMANAMNTYLDKVKQDNDILREDVPTKTELFRKELNTLASKFDVTLWEEELTFNYIFSENNNLLPLVKF